MNATERARALRDLQPEDVAALAAGKVPVGALRLAYVRGDGTWLDAAIHLTEMLEAAKEGKR